MTRALTLSSLARLVVVFLLAGLSGCSGSSKNVTRDEQEAIKESLLGGLTAEMKASNKFKSFEGIDDPDAKDGKVKYVRVIYTVGDSKHEMLMKLKDGKVVGRYPNDAGDNWKTDVARKAFQ